MRCPLNADPVHSPAWNRLLLTGTLLASCICSASSEPPASASRDLLPKGASVHLPVPSSLDDNRKLVLLSSFPMASQGVVRSDPNYSVMLQCMTAIRPEPVLYWTFNGEPRGTGERLIIRQLSSEDLGTYGCVAKNSEGQYFSNTVNISLSKVDMDPTDELIEPDFIITVSGGSAIALIVAGSIGLVIVLGGIGSAITQAQRTGGRRTRRCC